MRKEACAHCANCAIEQAVGFMGEARHHCMLTNREKKPDGYCDEYEKGEPATAVCGGEVILTHPAINGYHW